MRVVARTFLVALCLAGISAPSRAEFRHISSRFFGGDGGDVMRSDTFNFPSKRIVVNARGDVFLCVSAHTRITFGTDLIGPGIVGAVLNSSGAPVWDRVLYQATQSNVVISSVALGEDGSVVLVGTFNGGTVDFGGGPMTSTGSDPFVVKLDPAGHVKWQRRYDGVFGVGANGVALAHNGDVFVVGSDRNNIDFGGGIIINLGNSDVFALRLNGETGAHMWSHGYGQAGAQEGLDIASGPDDSITLLCTIAGGIDFGGGLLVRGGGNIALANLDGDGNHVWSRVVGGQQGGTPQAIAVDGAGNTIVGGFFARAMDPGNGTLLISMATSRVTGFLASYRPGGDYRWSYALLDSLESMVRAIATTESGDCVALATKKGELEGHGPNVPPAGYLFMEFDSLGTLGAAHGFGQPTLFNSSFLSTKGNDVYLAGASNGTIDFGGGELQMGPQGRVYLAHLAIRRPPQLTIGDLTARLRDGIDVELRWNLTSEEPLAGYYVTRQGDGSSEARVLQSGDAANGEAMLVDHDAQPGHRYTYEIMVETALGDLVSRSTVFDVPTVKTSLAQNTPNPFNPLTTFSYILAAPAHVSIAIYDLSGALVGKLDQGMQSAGRHEAKWAGHNWSGNLVASGVYFYRLEGAGDVPARKMVLLK
jgi:hypothetical protein